MIKFFKNNKILFIVVVIVIIGGACLAAILIGNTRSAMKQEGIQTAVAEAAESASPKPVQTPEVLSSKGLSELINCKETRRNYVIPSLGGYISYEAKTWKNIEPDNFAEIKDKAFAKTTEISKELFSYDVNSENAKALYYTDTDKDRKDIIKVITSDDAIVCTLTADTLDLIEIDYYFIPYAYDFEEQGNDQGSDYSRLPNASDLKIADRVAAYFGTSVKATGPKSCSSLSELIYEVFDVTLANGKYLMLALLNGELYAVSVYPTEACMNEDVHFEADIQYDPSVVKLASSQDFKEGQPDKGDMTKDEAKKMFISFRNFNGCTSNYAEPTMTFYIDYSGKRENYWHIESYMLKMDIASKSKLIISVDCVLWYSKPDLSNAEKAGPGGNKYTDYVHDILAAVYGTGSVSSVEDDAIEENDDSRTETAKMTDGTVYEFIFENGKLNEVDYYPSEESFKHDEGGWKADHVYINSITGKEFIPA